MLHTVLEIQHAILEKLSNVLKITNGNLLTRSHRSIWEHVSKRNGQEEHNTYPFTQCGFRLKIIVCFLKQNARIS